MVIERDQCPDVKRVHFRNAHGDRFAPALIKRASCPAQKSLKVIPARNAILDFECRATSILAHFDESHEKVQHAIAQLLHVGVLIGRAFVPVNGDALMHGTAIEVIFFA